MLLSKIANIAATDAETTVTIVSFAILAKTSIDATPANDPACARKPAPSP